LINCRVRTVSALTLLVGRSRAVRAPASPRHRVSVRCVARRERKDRSLDHPVRTRAGVATRTTQRRLCRTWRARPHRTLRYWRPLPDGCRRAAQTYADNRWTLSGRSLRPLREGQPAQVVRSLGGMAAGCKECPFVGLQKLNPVADVASISNITVKAKFRT